MNAETRIIVNKVATNLEYWRNTLCNTEPIGPQLRRRIGLSDSLYKKLYNYAIGRVDWDEVAKCIPIGIHLRDAVPGKDYTVIRSYLAKCKNGDTIRVHKCSDHIHLETEGVVRWETFYSAGIPDVWLTIVEKPMALSCVSDAKVSAVDIYSSDPDYRVGDKIKVHHNTGILAALKVRQLAMELREKLPSLHDKDDFDKIIDLNVISLEDVSNIVIRADSIWLKEL